MNNNINSNFPNGYFKYSRSRINDYALARLFFSTSIAYHEIPYGISRQSLFKESMPYIFQPGLKAKP